MPLKNALGRLGEEIAAQLLTDFGYEVLETNWRCDRGEIDIIASVDRTLVICEVKTRSSTAFGDPAEAVGLVKASRLRLLATRWLAEQSDSWDAVRFDVIAIVRGPRGPAQVQHLQGAF